MRSTLRRFSPLLGAVVLLLSTPRASAENVRLVKGGPSGKAAKKRAVSSIEGVYKEFAVCWRGPRPERVRIELTVGARGKVKRAVRKSRNAVSQCVAGVLAVQKLAGSGAEYTMVVDIVPHVGAGSSPAGDGMKRIKKELKPYRKKLQICYQRVAAKNPKLEGGVKLGFLIRSDGRVVDPEIKSSTLGSREVERCLVDTMKAARLSARPNRKTISFALTLNFSGGPSGTGSPVGTGSLKPQKDGPVPAAVLTKVMNANKPQFSACYDEQAHRDPKLAGRVVLRFTIRDDGTVRNVKIRETTLKNSKVESCIVVVGKTLRFPGENGRAKTRVIYPFEFSRR